MFKNLWVYIQDAFNWIKLNVQVETTNPITTNTPVASSVAPVLTPSQKISDFFLTHNNSYETFYPPVTGTIVNAIIHKITEEQATELGNLIVTNSVSVSGDYNYLSACIFQESQGDEACFNRNLKEHNGVISFDGTDWGLCQMAGTFLSSRPGMSGLSESEMQAKALTAAWSVPAMAEIMAENLKWAEQVLPSVLTTMEKLNTTSLSHVQWLATGAYNRGQNGILEAVKSLNYANMQHPFAVAKWYSMLKSS